MNFHILTLFPKAFPGALDVSIIKNAQEKGIYNLFIHDLRQFGECDKAHEKTHYKRIIDDKPYGGGAGMIIKCQPIDQAIITLGLENTYKIFTAPNGYKFSHSVAKAFSKIPLDILILCGRYEGVDERVLEKWDFRKISIGDYVLCGGEVAAQVMIESIVRLLPGVVGKQESIEYDSFSQHLEGLPEHAQYTTPAIWQNRSVPTALLSGDHARIAAYNSIMRKHKKT